MKLREKFSALGDKSFVKKMMVQSAYGTMQLENQGISLVKIEHLYDKVQGEKQTLNSERQ